jgi:hypothetical protein
LKRRNSERRIREISRVSLQRVPDAALGCGGKCMALYQVFNRFVPSDLLVPPIAVELGELVALIYRSDKEQPGSPKNYIHFMEEQPRLVSNIEGTQLYIVGGSYRVTPRGIEG